MTDLELQALITLVNAESVMMEGFNKWREMQGYGPGYTEMGSYACKLEQEMKRRGVIS